MHLTRTEGDTFEQHTATQRRSLDFAAGEESYGLAIWDPSVSRHTPKLWGRS